MEHKLITTNKDIHKLLSTKIYENEIGTIIKIVQSIQTQVYIISFSLNLDN